MIQLGGVAPVGWAKRTWAGWANRLFATSARKRDPANNDPGRRATSTPTQGGRRRQAGPTWSTGALSYGALILVLAVIINFISSTNTLYDWSLVGAEVLLGLGTAIAIGWAGLPAFGQGLYFAVGGYATGLLAGRALSPIVLLFLGAAAAGAMALLFALASMRLRFITFAMWSLIASQVVYQVLFTVNIFGAENGISGISRGLIFGIDLQSAGAWFWYVTAVVVVATVGARALYNSRFGYSIRACRDQQARAEALGIHTWRVRLMAFTVGGVVCGAGGVLYAESESVVDPSMAVWTTSATAIIIVLIGGMKKFFGYAVGAVIYEWLVLTITSGTASPDLWLGIIIVVIVALSPGGLLELASRTVDGIGHWVSQHRGQGREESVAPEKDPAQSKEQYL